MKKPGLCSSRTLVSNCVYGEAIADYLPEYTDALASLACTDRHIARRIAERTFSFALRSPAARTLLTESITLDKKPMQWYLADALLAKRDGHKENPCEGVMALTKNTISTLRKLVDRTRRAGGSNQGSR